MNPYQKRMKDALDKIEAIRKKAEGEKRAMTVEEVAERARLMGEFTAAEAEWQSVQAEDELRARAYGDGQGTAATLPGDGPITIADAPIYRGSPASMLGAQLLDVRAMDTPGTGERERSEARSRLEKNERRNAEKLEAQAKKENRAAGTGGFTVGIPSEGGFFLQGETAVDLMTAGFNNSEVLSRCQSRTLTAGTQFVEVIGIDETSRATGSRGGGVRVYTTAELELLTQSKAAFKKIRIEPKKLTGLYYASSEVLANVTFLGQEMRGLFGEEFAFKGQDLVIRGTGAGEPLGVLNAPCLVTASKTGGQQADTITTDNILAMESKLWNEGPNVCYLVNRETKPQLAVLSVSVGTGGVLAPLYKSDFYQGKRMSTLNGLPCITIEQAAALGDKGDIILFDGSQYLTANKGDINEAMSIHVMFLYDQSTFRFIWYFDGQPRWAASVTPYKGATGAKVGPFVTLEAR